MAVSYVDGNQTVYDIDQAGSPGPSTSWTIPVPTAGGALVAGDLLIASVTWDTASATNPSRTLPSGWTTITGLQVMTASTSHAHTEGIYHFVTSGEAGASPTWTITPNGSTAMEGNIAVSRFRGVDQADPFAKAAPIFAGTAVTTGAVTAPSITTTSANAMLVTGMAIRNGSLTLTNVTTGYTVGGNAFFGNGRSTALAHKLLATAGASGTAAWNLSGTANPKYAWQTALKEGAAAPAGDAELKYNGSIWVPQTRLRYNGSTWVTELIDRL